MTAALGFTQAVTGDDMLRTAFAAISAGADAVITARGYEMVRLLSAELIPAAVTSASCRANPPGSAPCARSARRPPKPSTCGTAFAASKTPAAFAAECELIPAAVLSEITSHLPCHDLARIGRGRRRDFPLRLRHLRRVGEAASPCESVGRPRKLHKAMRDERVKALSGFRAAVRPPASPASEQIAEIPGRELEDFGARLGAVQK